MFNRRAFLGTLAATVAGLMLDPERALWLPGAKSIFLPALKPSIVSPMALTIGDIVTLDGIYERTPRPYTVLKQFVITADVSSSDVPLSCVHPPIITDGWYTNVSGVLTPHHRVRPLFVGRTIAVTTQMGA